MADIRMVGRVGVRLQVGGGTDVIRMGGVILRLFLGSAALADRGMRSTECHSSLFVYCCWNWRPVRVMQ